MYTKTGTLTTMHTVVQQQILKQELRSIHVDRDLRPNLNV